MWYDGLSATLKTEFGSPPSNHGYPDLDKPRHGITEISIIWRLKSKTLEMDMGRNYSKYFVSLIVYKNFNKNKKQVRIFFNFLVCRNYILFYQIFAVSFIKC